MAYLADLYAKGQLAVVGQVGPTPAPLRKVDGFAQTVNGIPLVPGIGSHVDQYREWLQQKRSGIYYGWGGLMAEQFVAQNGNPVLTNISTAQFSPLLGGRTVNQFTVGTDGAPLSEYLSDYQDRENTTATIAGNPDSRVNLLEREVALVFDRLRKGADTLTSSMLPMSAFLTQPPST
ncbi:hypothetical protein, partial [Blastomonas sp. UPD001]|uniref:hypothetical protein n=1 Tax=Blastomonas sp. UPD001 TaxID=2217673 RepID=UPI001300344E